jgi:hypothetical protein
MPRYWVISPFDSERSELWEKVWKRNLDDDFISIGWGELGDISSLDEERLFQRIRRKWPDQDSGAARRDCRMLYTFYHSVKPGDRLIARRGRKKLAAIGTVKAPAYFDPNKHRTARNSAGIPYPNHLDVAWAKSPRDKPFAEQVFSILTIYGISMDKFRLLTNSNQSSLAGDLDAIIKQDIAATTKEALVSARIGQGVFRTQVLRLWSNRCAVTHSAVLDAIRASHIKPWSESTNEERLDPRNGLPLVASLDALFDTGLISFEPSGIMMISSKLDASEQRIFGIRSQFCIG